MPILTRMKPNLYKDSVALMRIAEKVLQDSAVSRATLVMGTPANKEILEEAAMLQWSGRLRSRAQALQWLAAAAKSR